LLGKEELQCNFWLEMLIAAEKKRGGKRRSLDLPGPGRPGSLERSWTVIAEAINAGGSRPVFNAGAFYTVGANKNPAGMSPRGF
jgi:hypothetical protein